MLHPIGTSAGLDYARRGGFHLAEAHDTSRPVQLGTLSNTRGPPLRSSCRPCSGAARPRFPGRRRRLPCGTRSRRWAWRTTGRFRRQRTDRPRTATTGLRSRPNPNRPRALQIPASCRSPPPPQAASMRKLGPARRSHDRMHPRPLLRECFDAAALFHDSHRTDSGGNDGRSMRVSRGRPRARTQRRQTSAAPSLPRRPTTPAPIAVRSRKISRDPLHGSIGSSSTDARRCASRSARNTSRSRGVIAS